MNTSDELNKTKSNIIQSLVITSDPQYPWTPKMDNNDNSESEAITKIVSENLIREQYNSINSYDRGIVLINGDITAYGHSWQRDKMKSLLDILNRRHFYGLGNHDIENNLNDCWQNGCVTGSLAYYVGHVKRIPATFLDEMDIEAHHRGHKGSFAYSINYGEIYSIQLNNYPTMELDINPAFKDPYKMYSTLDWLEKVLQKASALGKIIIVNVHMPDDWKGGPSERFKKLLKDYDVKAAFCGHYHKNLGLYDNNFRDYFGDVPVFLSGSASQRSYLIVEQTARELLVYSVRNNDWKAKKLEKRIELKQDSRETLRIVPAINTNTALEVKVSNGNNVVLGEIKDTPYQKWILEYDNSKKAYQIICPWNNKLILAWNAYNGSKNVFATLNTHNEEHYWIPEDVGDNYYIIKNKKNTNLVLDVDGANPNIGTNIKVNERHPVNSEHRKAQKFKLVKNKLSSDFKKDQVELSL